MPATRWIPWEDLRVGYVVRGYEGSFGPTPLDDLLGKRVTRVIPPDVEAPHGRVFLDDIDFGYLVGYRWLVEDGSPTESPPMPAAASVPEAKVETKAPEPDPPRVSDRWSLLEPYGEPLKR